jgi:anti-sigma-K factor RskA
VPSHDNPAYQEYLEVWMTKHTGHVVSLTVLPDGRHAIEIVLNDGETMPLGTRVEVRRV